MAQLRDTIKMIRLPLISFLIYVALATALIILEGKSVASPPQSPVHAVAFRLDDVQDRWLSSVQRSVIQLFLEYDVPLTLGVIGGFIGDDIELVSAIESGLGTLEIANHGLHAVNGTDGRSILLSQQSDVTKREILEANARIESIFGTRPSVYIPHQNQINARLLSVVATLGFSHVSSSCSWHLDPDWPCPDAFVYRSADSCKESDQHGLLHVSAGAATEWEPAVGKRFGDPSAVLNEIRLSIDQYGYAVVMLHPMDFVNMDESPNTESLHNLELLIKRIKESATFKESYISDIYKHCL